MEEMRSHIRCCRASSRASCSCRCCSSGLWEEALPEDDGAGALPEDDGAAGLPQAARDRTNSAESSAERTDFIAASFKTGRVEGISAITV